MVTLQFVAGHWHDIGSDAIRWFTWSDYSHVDLVLPDQTLLGARIKGGVRVRKPNYEPWAKVLRAQVDAPDSVYDIAKSQIGKPYDWRGILNFGIHLRDARDWRDGSSWFCSEFIAWAMEQAGTPLLNQKTYVFRVTPRDLLVSPKLLY